MSNNTKHEHIDSWKNCKEAFRRQLALNKKQLEGDFHPHWNNFVKILKKETPKRVVDIGCGVGCYYPICRDLKIDYIGYDYSFHATDLADEAWGWSGTFIPARYEEITSKDIKEGDLVVANGLIDILPNGDECLKHLLSISADRLLLQRIRMTDKPSHATNYSAYDITVYEFRYNEEEFFETVKNAGYNCSDVTGIFDPSENIFDIEIRKPE